MKKLIYIFTISCLLFIPSARDCYSQPSITWNRLYDGGFNGKDYGDGLCQTIDGNIIISGRTLFPSVTQALKLNPNGDIIWLKHYFVTYGEAITCTNDGGCLIASPSFLKINLEGDSVWYRNYLNYGVSHLYSVKQCNDGDFITCGSAYNDSGYIMKTDMYGNLQWYSVISWNIKTIELYSLSEAYTNGYMVVGASWDFNVPVRPSIVRLDSNGNVMWMKINQISDSLGYAKSVEKLYPYYLIGCSNGFMKVDDQGNIISLKLITFGKDGIKDLKVINTNRFVFTANHYELNPLIEISRVFITDSSGNVLYSHSLEFSVYVKLKKIQLVGNGDIVFAGDAARYDTSKSDFYAIRTNANLNFPPIKVQNITNSVPDEFRLYQNYPNPFNSCTEITYELPATVYIKLAVYDILGREIRVLVNKNQLAGKYEVNWNTFNYPSGIYFYKITAISTQYQINSIVFSESKKMILVK